MSMPFNDEMRAKTEGRQNMQKRLDFAMQTLYAVSMPHHDNSTLGEVAMSENVWHNDM